MTFTSLENYKSAAAKLLVKGPTALIFLEDDVEVGSTLRHHLDMGFRNIVAFGATDIEIPDDIAEQIHRVEVNVLDPGMSEKIVNLTIAACPGQWLYYCYNTEYLFFPFCEDRTIGEALAFITEERRASVLTYVVDLYASDLSDAPNAVSLETAHLDKSGYYALARKDPDGEFAERQLDFFGGLRWRFEEHVPVPRRRIDRIALFKAAPGLAFRGDHTLSDPEYNTYACPWHHSMTAALCSFRTAKALKRNPGSSHKISSFHWHNSTPFNWHSQQLLDLGLMEPGQWF